MDLEKRSAFCQKIKEYETENRSIIYSEESDFSYDQPRIHGYYLKGDRCFGAQDWGAKGRTNSIGALLRDVF